MQEALLLRGFLYKYRQELKTCDLHKALQFHRNNNISNSSNKTQEQLLVIAKDGYNWPKAATIYQRRLPFVLTTNTLNTVDTQLWN